MTRHRAALILTHNRPELLADCIAAIAPQVDQVLVLDNASDPPAQVPDGTMIHHILDQPPNLAKLWNHGFDFYAGLFGGEPHDIAVLCDDVTVPDSWFSAVTEAMRITGAVAGCSNPHNRQHPPVLKQQPDADIMGRMTGWAWIRASEPALRADEAMRWWWQDTDADFQSRLAGGMVMIGGFYTLNREMGHYTNVKPELGEQTGRDREAFVAKWGRAPW